MFEQNVIRHRTVPRPINIGISMAENAVGQIVANKGFKNFDVDDMLYDGVIGGISGAISGKGSGTEHLLKLGIQSVKRTVNTAVNRGLSAGLNVAKKALSYYGKNSVRYYKDFIRLLPKDIVSSIGANFVSSHKVKSKLR